jgi:hypothetical protein
MVTHSTNSGQANNLVAQSDYQAALDGLEKYYSTQQNNNCLAKASLASMVHNLTRVVQPISDKDFHDHVDRYHYVQEEEEEEEGRDDDADDNQNYVVKEEVHDGYNLMEEEEYESEDLLDPQALKEAQKLRGQVRQLALRVQKLRDSVLQRALRMSSNANNSDVDVRPSFVIPQEVVAPIPTSIQALMKVLNHSRLADLPKKVQLFQATLETIKKETKEDRSLSQTEAAILAREEQTEDARKVLVEATIDETPQDRLANFLLMQD